ncbi:MAG: hypothetical protein ACRD7E_11515, partial [Bryobacteraceae bacterium]
PYSFWREFAEIENVVAIKIAPFNRYQTLDVVRAVADSGRASEIALYTGNDDSIVVDLLTEFRFSDERTGRAARHQRKEELGGLGRTARVLCARASEESVILLLHVIARPASSSPFAA